MRLLQLRTCAAQGFSQDSDNLLVGWQWRPQVDDVFLVIELEPCEDAHIVVPGDDVQMNVCILVHYRVLRQTLNPCTRSCTIVRPKRFSHGCTNQ